MSQVTIQSNASGTGIFTIASPNSNTNRTLTLPDQTGTVLTNTGPFTADAAAANGTVTVDASSNVAIGGTPGANTKFTVYTSNGSTTTSDAVISRSGTTSGSIGQSACLQLSNASAARAVMLQASPDGACQIWSYLGPSGGWYKPMQVYGESDAMLSVSTIGGVTDLRAVNQVNNTWRWMRVQEGGVLIVGSGSPAADAKITVGGRVYGNSPRYEGGYYINCPDTSIGRVLRASGYLEWTSDVGAIGTNYFLSDIRKKENITLSTFNSSALISKIEFIGFDWKPDSGNSGHVDVGVSAQQLQTLDNRLVNELSDGSLMVNEPALVAHMAKALQEQQAIITALTARIEALEAK